MIMLNEFLKTISMRADDNDELYAILREFLEPDTNDKKIHGGAVIRTVFMTLICITFPKIFVNCISSGVNLSHFECCLVWFIFDYLKRKS